MFDIYIVFSGMSFINLVNATVFFGRFLRWFSGLSTGLSFGWSFFNLPKKQIKNFGPSKPGQRSTFSCSFFGRIEDTKISFQDQLTFRT